MSGQLQEICDDIERKQFAREVKRAQRRAFGTIQEETHEAKTTDQRYEDWKTRPKTFTMPKDVFEFLQKQHE